MINNEKITEAFNKRYISQISANEKNENNKILLEEFPFLKVNGHYFYSDPDNFNSNEYNWLDDMEPGWRRAFGLYMCIDLKEALKKDKLEDFEIMQIKEKFGSLRFYTSDNTKNINHVINKYEELSKYICGECGRPAEYITTGWIYPICEKCKESHTSKVKNIKDFYKDELRNKTVEEKIQEIMKM